MIFEVLTALSCYCRQLGEPAHRSRCECGCGASKDGSRQQQQQRRRGRRAAAVGRTHPAASTLAIRSAPSVLHSSVATWLSCLSGICLIGHGPQTMSLAMHSQVLSHHSIVDKVRIGHHQANGVITAPPNPLQVAPMTSVRAQDCYSWSPHTTAGIHPPAGAGTRPPLPPRPSPSQSKPPMANGTAATAAANGAQQPARAAGDTGTAVAPPAANGGSGGLPQTMDISQLMSLLSGGGSAGGAGSQSQAVTTAAVVRV